MYHTSTSDFEKNPTPFIITCATERIYSLQDSESWKPDVVSSLERTESWCCSACRCRSPASLHLLMPRRRRESTFLNKCLKGSCLKHLWPQSFWNNWLNSQKTLMQQCADSALWVSCQESTLVGATHPSISLHGRRPVAEHCGRHPQVQSKHDHKPHENCKVTGGH